MNRNGAAIAMHQRELGIRHLTRTRRATQLPHCFKHMKKSTA